MTMLIRMIILFVLLLALLHPILILAITPTGELDIRTTSSSIYIAPSSFSAELVSESKAIYRRIIRPTSNRDGCSPSLPHLSVGSQFYLLVERSNCSFADKAIAAYNVGAKGVIIYNSLEGIYQGNNYAGETDYECGNGQGYIQNVTYPVYSDAMDDSMPTSCTQSTQCSSGKCVLTSNVTSEYGYKVCCAWDLYITMGVGSSDSSTDDNDGKESNILSAFIRMKDEQVLSSYSELDDLSMYVVIFDRSTSYIDWASIIIWLIAVATITICGVKNALSDTRKASYHKDIIADDNDAVLVEPTVIESSSSSSSSSSSNAGTYGSITDSSSIRLPSTHTKADTSSTDTADDGETIEITPYHAVGFILVSSLFLILLYFVDLYAFVTWLYLFAATFAMYSESCFRVLKLLYYAYCVTETTDSEYTSNSSNTSVIYYNILKAVSIAISVSISVTWYVYKNESWVWILQDFMGMNVCVMFLSMIQLPNLKTASTLMSLAFLYDIFFVFVSPYIFNSSVMVDVATGGSSTYHDDENYCEKYPSDTTCASTSLPMLMVVPTINSYESSESMLGLGDIVLPGLLLVWSARYDIRIYGSMTVAFMKHGYFLMNIIGYGIGLMMANIAVSLFQTGQPALLYIVPCTLAPTLYRAYLSGSLELLWIKLPVMQLIALPLQYHEEREHLLTAVEAVASFSRSGKNSSIISASIDNTAIVCDNDDTFLVI